MLPVARATHTFFNAICFFFFSSIRRHTRWPRDWSSVVCSSDLAEQAPKDTARHGNSNDKGKQKARRGQLIVERYKVGDEIGGEHRLDAIEGEAGERQTAKVAEIGKRRVGKEWSSKVSGKRTSGK